MSNRIIFVSSIMTSSVADILAYVTEMDAALLPCLPARELQAADRSSHQYLHVEVERHSREFMEAAKKLQLFFILMAHEHPPSREKLLRKEIAALEAELKAKDEQVERQLKLISKWQQLLSAQKATCTGELDKV